MKRQAKNLVIEEPATDGVALISRSEILIKTVLWTGDLTTS